jgi:hypothetical protein
VFRLDKATLHVTRHVLTLVEQVKRGLLKIGACGANPGLSELFQLARQQQRGCT